MYVNNTSAISTQNSMIYKRSCIDDLYCEIVWCLVYCNHLP